MAAEGEELGWEGGGRETSQGLLQGLKGQKAEQLCCGRAWGKVINTGWSPTTIQEAHRYPGGSLLG